MTGENSTLPRAAALMFTACVGTSYRCASAACGVRGECGFDCGMYVSPEACSYVEFVRDASHPERRPADSARSASYKRPPATTPARGAPPPASRSRRLACGCAFDTCIDHRPRPQSGLRSLQPPPRLSMTMRGLLWGAPPGRDRRQRSAGAGPTRNGPSGVARFDYAPRRPW